MRRARTVSACGVKERNWYVWHKITVLRTRVNFLSWRKATTTRATQAGAQRRQRALVASREPHARGSAATAALRYSRCFFGLPAGRFDFGFDFDVCLASGSAGSAPRSTFGIVSDFRHSWEV